MFLLCLAPRLEALEVPRALWVFIVLGAICACCVGAVIEVRQNIMSNCCKIKNK